MSEQVQPPALGLLMDWEICPGTTAEMPVAITHGNFVARDAGLYVCVSPQDDNGQDVVGQCVSAQMLEQVFSQFVQFTPVLLQALIDLGPVKINGKKLDFSKAKIIDIGEYLAAKNKAKEAQK